jgi:hypothetical protein
MESEVNEQKLIKNLGIRLEQKTIELAEREKQIVMLREHAKAIRGHMNLYRLFSCEGSDSYDPEYAEKNLDKVSEHAEALAATDDLSGCILCDAEPVAWRYENKNVKGTWYITWTKPDDSFNQRGLHERSIK